MITDPRFSQKRFFILLLFIVLLLIVASCNGGGNIISPSLPFWCTAELIEPNNSGSAIDAQIAMNGAIKAIAVWTYRNGSYYKIWANYFDEAAWGAAVVEGG